MGSLSNLVFMAVNVRMSNALLGSLSVVFFLLMFPSVCELGLLFLFSEMLDEQDEVLCFRSKLRVLLRVFGKFCDGSINQRSLVHSPPFLRLITANCCRPRNVRPFDFFPSFFRRFDRRSALN